MNAMNNEIPEELLTPENLRRAMKAFKKRLKLMRLDDESGLGIGSGPKSREAGITAVTPPDRYPQAVWDKLVELGKLRKASHGLYQLQPQDNKPHG